MVMIQVPELPGHGLKSQLYHFLALCPVINDSLSPALSSLICKNHRVVVRIMDYAPHCTWAGGEGSVASERRKQGALDPQCPIPLRGAE